MQHQEQQEHHAVLQRQALNRSDTVREHRSEGLHVQDTVASLAATPLQLAALDVALLQFRQAVSSRTGDPHETAREGLSGAGQQLPHLQQIQRSFGKHDVSSVVAHTDQPAVGAARNLGAKGYAAGNHVVLTDTSDLHTAAHEAAHVVQQRGGVQLKGGMGQVGDRYEQHADQVADLVVQGKSAEGLLDRHANGGGGSGLQLSDDAASEEGAGAHEAVPMPVRLFKVTDKGLEVKVGAFPDGAATGWLVVGGEWVQATSIRRVKSGVILIFQGVSPEDASLSYVVASSEKPTLSAADYEESGFGTGVAKKDMEAEQAQEHRDQESSDSEATSVPTDSEAPAEASDGTEHAESDVSEAEKGGASHASGDKDSDEEVPLTVKAWKFQLNASHKDIRGRVLKAKATLGDNPEEIKGWLDRLKVVKDATKLLTDGPTLHIDGGSLTKELNAIEIEFEAWMNRGESAN